MTAEVCPYCRTKIGAEDQSLKCEGCGTAHHADCYAENGGCTIFGCSKAPGDEPKVSVSTPELVAVATSAPVPVTSARLPSAPPPPPPGVALPLPPPASDAELRQVASQIVPSIFGGFGGASSTPTVPEPEVHTPKSRTSFILLGALLGAFGAHNFYAGYHKKAWIQLAIAVLTLGFGIPMSWMWAVIDVCTVNLDSHGVQFES
jgi:TM2 domain/Prokaryotic RING finger family 1